MPRIIRAFALALILSIVFSTTTFYGECNKVRGKVLRLHVLANSNSDEDQQLKLMVRDTILENSAGIFDGASDSSEAYQTAKLQLAELEQLAQNRVNELGYNYKVKAELTEMYFNTRRYESSNLEKVTETITLPAGRYDALRISIGEAAGQNWWCVIFPPICLSAAAEISEANEFSDVKKPKEISEILEPEEEEIVTKSDKFEVRFKIVEVFEGARERLNKLFS